MASTRRLAAILAADVAGYSRLMGVDEEGTLERLKAHRRLLTDPKIAEHHGRIVKTTGDGLLAEFASVVDAVRCAAEVQRGMLDREPDLPDERRIRLRIGVNLGDIIAEGDDIFGDGVNVAARLEALAEPGGICISRTVRDHIRGKLPYAFEDMGEQNVKNICSTGAGLCAAYQSSRRSADGERTARGANLAARHCATAVDRRAALCQPQRRPGAGIFRRRDHRGSDDRSVADRGQFRDLAQYRVYL
jgi:class 3 adenylate cyclase